MYNDKKIGVGIITYNRPEKFMRLYKQIEAIEYVDTIVVVKNKEVDYKENDPIKIQNSKLKYFNVLGDVGVGKCKNTALQCMLDDGCDSLFLIEDDVILKKDDVFKQYIDTANEFNLGHLNFCRAWDSITKKYLFPFVTIYGKQHKLQLFRRLCGDFQYFTKDALEKVGLIDDVHYINAFEHAEHTYRMSLSRMYTPFNAFADIANSDQYIVDDGVQTTIDHSSHEYDKRIIDGMNAFIHQYGYAMAQIPIPTVETLKKYFSTK